MRPFGLSFVFAPYKNSEAVHPKIRVAVSTRVLAEIMWKRSTRHGLVHSRTSIVLGTAPNYRLAAVDHAYPIGIRTTSTAQRITD